MHNNEFDFINRFLVANAGKRADVVLGIGDDCALLQVPLGNELAVSIDTSVEGVHFTQTAASAADIGYKSLAVSLSDLAAMGAMPAWVMAAITLPKLDEEWLQEFTAGFFELVRHYNLQLVGGDTTQGPLAITTQVFGFVPQAKALRRSGAQIGDLIYVTGTLGDAGLALQVLKNQIQISPAYHSYIFSRLNRPAIRLQEGLILRDLAHAAIDISDGLAADLGHVLKSSHVGATIHTEKLPFSKALRDTVSHVEALHLALTAGDDYELCFTAPVFAHEAIIKSLDALSCSCTCIGKIEAEPGLRILQKNDEAFVLDKMGYQHF